MQKRFAFLVAMLMMILSSAMAQVTTSGINGKVTLQATSEDVIGATIQAVHVPSGTKYAAVTNAKGAYSIQGMRAGGPYTITVTYIGAQSKTFENVQLSLGESYGLNVWLPDDATALGEVVVTGQAGINNTKNGAAQSISNRQIQELPSINHSVSDIARINPFIKVTEGGAMTIAGSNNRYNAIMIDGAMSNDVFGLTQNGANGGQTGAQPFSMETVEQLQVSIAPFDVRQSGFTGGSINAITKSGTNDFHGSVYSYFQNGSLVGNKYRLHDKSGDSADYGNMTDYTLGATLGGPIVKDKLFFFANFERTSKEYDNAWSTNNGMSNVDFNIANEVYNFIKNEAAKQGVTYTGTLGTPKEYTYSDKVGLKLDWNIDDRNHAALRWSFVDASTNNSTSGASALNTSDYAYDQVSKTNSIVFELQSRIGKNMNNEFHVSMTNVRDKRNPGDPFPMFSISNVGKGTVNIGNERSSMANALSQDIYTLTDNFTVNAGNHALTFGTHDELYRFGNLFCQDNYGSYYFDSPEKLYAGVVKRFRYGQAVESVTGTKRWTPRFGAGQIGLYAQDKWSITNNFDLTYGLRIDMPFMIDTPEENKEFNALAAQKGWNVQTNQKISSKPMWSPRAGFRWDILGNRNLILRGGVGIFTGRVPYVWISNNFSNTGVMQLSYDANGEGKNTNTKIYYSPTESYHNLPVGSDGSPAFTAQTINVFKKDFRFSQQLRADLALDFKALGIDWTVEGIYSKTLNDMFVKKLNIEATGENNPIDGRPMFRTISGMPKIYMLDNVSKGYSYNVSIMGQKHFDFGLDLMASYTYGQSYTVNNGSSSVCASNFQYNYTHGNPNEPILEKSNFNQPHKIMVSAYQHINWSKYNQTTIGLIYTANSGSPYSIYVNGDVNGDGESNDLMFIPTKEQIGKMSWSEASQADGFNAWIESDKYLSAHRGEFYERNAANEDFEHRLDLHFDHKFSFKIGKDMRSLQIGCDILNFTNMLCKSWGSTLSQGGYNYYSPLSLSGGKYTFKGGANYDMRNWSDYYSRWRMQISAKLTF